MALGSSDERDLLLPLFAGIAETPIWEDFLRRLRARTGAESICLLRRSVGTGERPTQWRAIGGVHNRNGRYIGHPVDADLIPYLSLRPFRVYSLYEFIMSAGRDEAALRRRKLENAGIADARFIRLPAIEERDVWLVAFHDRQEFSAADSALLSALAPHMALALTMLGEREKLRLRAAIAEQTLSQIGVGQAAFDKDGRVIVADTVATAALDSQPGEFPRLPNRSRQALAAACAELKGLPDDARRLLTRASPDVADLLLRPAPHFESALGDRAAAVGLVRRNAREDAISAARVIAESHGLSIREAALAEAMTRGESIVEAGAALQLTPETARNYSKRIYAKTGASGQADLVRMVLTGLAPFA